MFYLLEICIKYKKNVIEIFSRQSKEVIFYDTQLFPVKIVNRIIFLQKLVQNVAKTFKKTAW